MKQDKKGNRQKTKTTLVGGENNQRKGDRTLQSSGVKGKEKKPHISLIPQGGGKKSSVGIKM